jgi:AcrR family transcriptional regulator
MGTKERKEREKKQVRIQILEAARDLFFSRGYEATSIRNIAEKVEYSPGAIYLYFKDKDNIFQELQREGFHLLNANMRVLGAVGDSFERLKAMGRIYMNFAKEYPEYYELMFVIKAPMRALEEDQEWVEGRDAYHFLIQVIDDCKANNRFNNHNTEAFAYYIWATMHGIITLGSNDRKRVVCDIHRENIEELAYLEFIKMLEGQ